MNRNEAELMQYRSPVGRGPSGNTCPRCESPCLLRSSTLTMPWLSSLFSTMFSSTSGLVKLGQPVPESNLSVEAKRGSPDTTST